MKYINPKKSIHLRNNTKYFNPDTDKAYNTFGSPESYQSRRIKIEGYETRLYWQFRYCNEHNGQTFFYTLTYNDANMPNHYGINCFDYEDLRDLLTGGFRKQLLRKYGTTFKYFIGAELGDGKGERGLHNNPHYHILFFLEDAKNERFPYKVISPVDFRHLVRLYWQGFDEDTDGRRDYRTECKYGIAREGENIGLVTDFRAVQYVSKYVCKDVALKQGEKKVERKVRMKIKNDGKLSIEILESFFDEVLFEYFNIPLDAKHTAWQMNEIELVEHCLPHFFDLYDDLGLPRDGFPKSAAAWSIIYNYDLWSDYRKFKKTKIEEKVRLALNEWRNRYCNKCRISHGVGDYALDFIGDEMEPVFQVPSKRGFKNRPISMYYYRKLYTKVIIDDAGSPIRVLNDLGIKYKLSRLDKQIEKKIEVAKNNLSLIVDNSELFEKMRDSDINTEVSMHFSDFLERLNYLLKENNIEEILRRYAEYKLVYEDRFFSFDTYGDYSVCNFPELDLYEDYSRFLVPSIYSVSRSDLRLATFLESPSKDYLSYYQHPYFLRFIGIFNILDMCADYFFVQGDDKAQSEAEEVAATKRFHNKEKVKEFYKQFGL